MQIKNTPIHLTYCTNIHPANGWPQVLKNIQHYTIALKEKLSRNAPFGIGLRISDLESQQLLSGDNLSKFKTFLKENNLYVFTINGFPFGSFHKTQIKADVYAPDWRDADRIRYTERLITILSELLPEGMEGSISTSPLSYKPWVNVKDNQTWQEFTNSTIQITQKLIEVKNKKKKTIHIDFEPEPDCVLENIDEVITFYKDWLLKEGVSQLFKKLDISEEIAKQHILEHIRICFDTCHMSVEYVNAAQAFDQLKSLGIKIGKIQASSAVKIIFNSGDNREEIKDALLPYINSIYLHQVVQKNSDGTFTHYYDLDKALKHINDSKIMEWRIHFHVPIFFDKLKSFSSTQDELSEVIKIVKEQQLCNHIEMETYTWDVLPEHLKLDLVDSIEREYTWMLQQLERNK